MKSSFNKILCVIALLMGISLGKVHANQSGISSEIWMEIMEEPSVKGPYLMDLAKDHPEWVPELQAMIENEIEFIDFTSGALTEKQFKDSFGFGGLFDRAKGLIFTFQTFKGNWIDYMPTKRLGISKKGASQLKVQADTGAIFEYWGKDSLFGHGWLSPPTPSHPNGLIWYSAVGDKFGRARFMNHKDSKYYCEVEGMRAPGLEDLYEYASHLGVDLTQQDYKTVRQIFPNAEFWLASEEPGGSGAYTFDSRTGRVGVSSRYRQLNVACVRER